jgi:hypothetical protein
MKLPSFLDFAFLLSAIPPKEPKSAKTIVAEHEDFRLSLLATAVPGMPFRPLGYLLLAFLGSEAVRRDTRELGGGLSKLCRSIGAPELADEPRLVEDQLVRLARTLVQVEVVAKKKTTRVALFPLFSQLVLEGDEPGKGQKWHVRLSGDFSRILKQTAPTSIPEIPPVPPPGG